MNRLLVFLIIISSMKGCKSKEDKEMDTQHKYTNSLINETSPYLLQHAHNPVNWYAWNEETLELAKKENKLLLISIGYAACHWCHVMEHESFEDSTVAAVMNDNFISVKIDREERPDIDQVYMSAVQLLTGRGGWPLNCVALPDGRPIWGGTYFPKDKWINVLNQLSDLYQNEPNKAIEYAEKLTEGIKQSDLINLKTGTPSFTRTELDSVIINWEPAMDLKNGGRTGAPKFPMPSNFQFLLRYAVQSNNSKIMDYVNTTLTKMAYGGINDHVGGGFSRYSVDDRWHIPHFEKMLYDNAQLISLYSNAYSATKNPLFKQVVNETTRFIERELYNNDGAFYSSLDADSLTDEGELEEGAYYIWNEQELKNIIKSDYTLFANYYNVNSFGKWEKENYHLIRNTSNKDFAETNKISEKELENKIQLWKTSLLKEREKRNKPRLDDKILTSWNALMLKAYINAYTVFDDKAFLKIALKNAYFITNKQLKEDGGLFRNYKNGKSNIEAYLEDYATTIDAFISLYEATFDENWLMQAKQLTDYCFDHFYDDKSKMFFFTSDKDAKLVSRKIEIDDNVIPASNSIMANNLFKLGHYYSNKNYSSHAKIMLNNVKEHAVKYGAGASNWLNLYSNYIGDFYEIAISGKDAISKLKEVNKNYIPNMLLVGSTKESTLPLLIQKFSDKDTTIYVCVDGACQMPETETSKALKQVKIQF